MKSLQQLAIDYVKARTESEERKIYSQMLEQAACEEEVMCFIEEAYEL